MEVSIIKETHKFTAEEKKQWWDEGEWCNEPDLVEFEHCGLKCKVVRQAHKEIHAVDFHMFGGYLTGYVSVDKKHPCYAKGPLDQSTNGLEVHGGVTFNDFHEDGLYWIGFDCAHCYDITPSMEVLKKRYGLDLDGLSEMKKKYPDSQLFNPIYKNMSYTIGECKALAEQLEKMKGKSGR